MKEQVLHGIDGRYGNPHCQIDNYFITIIITHMAVISSRYSNINKKNSNKRKNS